MNRVLAFTGLLGVCLCLVRPSVGSDGYCSTPTAGPKVKVSFSSHRNKTGHWISQVSLQQSSDQKSVSGSRQEKPWQVDIEQSVNHCSGSDSIIDVTLTLIAPNRQPGTGYELFPGIGYYKFHDDVTTWPRAREICTEEGAHLVIINSEQESEGIKKLFARYPKITGATDNNWAWVGAKEVEGVHGQYVTMYDVPLNNTGFTRWSPGEPNNPTTGDYLVVSRSSGGLGDVPTSLGWNSPFICEHELW